MRAGADDPEVVVRTEVRGKGDPIQLDYRLEKTDRGWKIYDVNVLGVWLADAASSRRFAPHRQQLGPRRPDQRTWPSSTARRRAAPSAEATPMAAASCPPR
jgi:hypothetical protein